MNRNFWSSALLIMILGLIVSFQNCGKKDAPVESVSSGSSTSNNPATTTTVPTSVAPKVVLQEYKHVSGKYFLTGKPEDQIVLEKTSDFKKKGTITIYQTPDSSTGALCRFFIYASSSHLYTASKDGCDFFKSKTTEMKYEGIEGYANLPLGNSPNKYCASGLIPIYALSNDRDGVPVVERVRRYTASTEMRAQLKALKWEDEGISFCALQANVVD